MMNLTEAHGMSAFSAFCDTLDCIASCETRLTILWESSILPSECLGIPIAAW